MTDFNVSDHWSDNEPDWVKSLASSLDRRHGASAVLPLILIVDEVVNWVHLASGEDAWRKVQNRDSLTGDLDQTIAALGANVATTIDIPLKTFMAAFNHLTGSPRAVHLQPAREPYRPRLDRCPHHSLRAPSASRLRRGGRCQLG